MPIYIEYFIAFCGIWILVSLGYYLGWRGGQLYNAVVYSMAIGAYFSAYVTRDLGWPFSLALIATAGVGAVTAFLPSLVISRLPAFVCATATIAMIIVLQQVIRSLAFLGGAMGFFGIPHQRVAEVGDAQSIVADGGEDRPVGFQRVREYNA